MASEIVPYEPYHIPAVIAFNARLRGAGVPYAFPESNVPWWLPPSASTTLYQEHFLAVDGDVVRGGYILKHQEFVVCGKVMSIGAFQLPLSEGSFDRDHAAIGVQLLRDALRRQPLIYTLGIGSFDESAARLLIAARFFVEKVPFFFRVEHARPFLRQIRPLRSDRLRRIACDVGAVTGLGALGIGLLQRRGASAADPRPILADSPVALPTAVDGVWQGNAGAFDLAAVRDHRVVSHLYDAPGNRFIRVVIRDRDAVVGWAIVLATDARGHRYFGDMKVGSIVDLLAVPGFERALIDAAVARLRVEGVDIIVSNQSFGPVGSALHGAGFLSGPSNFLFAASPRLVALMGTVPNDLRTLYLNRGDGDGPINL